MALHFVGFERNIMKPETLQHMIAGIAMIFVAVAVTWPAKAAEPDLFPIGNPVIPVSICDLPGIRTMAEELATSSPPLGSVVGCQAIPKEIVHIQGVVRAFTDFEGDKAYIVRVGPGLYAIAWPGYNTPPRGWVKPQSAAKPEVPPTGFGI